jgi:hypothetical protein
MRIKVIKFHSGGNKHYNSFLTKSNKNPNTNTIEEFNA